jgi:peptidoglycan/LPS O-acetylase OafA/YrhL
MKTAFDVRDNSLDFLRLFFAVLVIFSHCFPLGVGRVYIEPMMRLTGGQTTLGTMAVESFFIISGFLIAHSYLRSRSISAYFRKRVARIYPGFVVCMVICGLIVAPLAGAISPFQHFAGRVVNFVFATLVLHEFSYQHAFSLNPNEAINGSVWTISYEFACYIAVALLGVGGLLRRKKVMLILFCVSLMALSGADFLVTLCRSGALHLAPILNHPYFCDKVLLRGPLIPAYLAGVAFYVYRERIPHDSVWAGISFCVLGLACVTPGTWHLAFPVAGTYLVFWLGFHPRVRPNFSRFLVWNLLVRVSDSATAGANGRGSTGSVFSVRCRRPFIHPRGVRELARRREMVFVTRARDKSRPDRKCGSRTGKIAGSCPGDCAHYVLVRDEVPERAAEHRVRQIGHASGR